MFGGARGEGFYVSLVMKIGVFFSEGLDIYLVKRT